MCVFRDLLLQAALDAFFFLDAFVSFNVLTRLHVCTYDRFERDIADNVVKQVDWTQEFYPCTLSSRTIVTL